MTRIAIPYHSGYGHTARVAQAIAEGAIKAGATVDIFKVDEITEANWAALDAADAIIFGAPTYMGGLSGPFKVFLDATSGRWAQGAWKDKLAAGFTNSASYSGDKLNTLQQFFITAMQHGMVWVGQAEAAPMFNEGEIPTFDALNRLGSFSGLMTQANHKASPDHMPPAGDLETAHRFGARVVATAKRIGAK